MSFIPKLNDPTIINIKLTNKGREQLSKGQLNFKYFTVGDSEIDYKFVNKTNFNPFNFNILNALDSNPNILSYIPANLSGSSFNIISDVPSIPTIVENTTAEFGMFSAVSGNTTILTDPLHIKQPDCIAKIDEVNGGTTLKLYKSSNYGSSVAEPSINDYIFIRWTNPNNISTDSYIIDKNNSMPNLFYKIENIVSGSLGGDNLIVTVDKPLPTFNNFGTGINAGVFVLYNDYFTSTTGNTPSFSTDDLNENVFSFFENVSLITNTYPFWNMSLVYSEEIAGVLSTMKNYGLFNTASYAGFVSYIQNQVSVYKNLGIIHYTNTSVGNNYGEGLYLNTPILNLPTIMWHNNSGNTMGLIIKPVGTQKILTGSTSGHSLNTEYFDIADEQGYVVGKVFNNLKLFIIEDQELLYAMSYKSNRSWTLPKPVLGFNLGVSSCIPCALTADIIGISPTTFGETGSIKISGITSTQPSAQVFIEIKESGNTTPLYFAKYSGNTININNLTPALYYVTIYDTSAPNCYITENIRINNVESILQLYDVNIII